MKSGRATTSSTGRGGIREIEFFAQTHQLIHGGRDPSLRLRGTRAALDALATAGRISADEAPMLGEAYDRLRTLEHRIQMVNDRQTHALPEGEALDSVARLDGHANGAALVAELREITDRVASAYDTLIPDEDEHRPVAVQADSLADNLDEMGFDEPTRLAERVTGWRDGRYRALRSPAALDAFDAMLPALLEALSQADGSRARFPQVGANSRERVLGDQPVPPDRGAPGHCSINSWRSSHWRRRWQTS